MSIYRHPSVMILRDGVAPFTELRAPIQQAVLTLAQGGQINVDASATRYSLIRLRLARTTHRRHKTLMLTARGEWFAWSIAEYHERVLAMAGADHLEG